MKKFMAVLLTLVLTFSLTTVVFANPGQNPNQRPGGAEANLGGVTVTVTGGGNNLVIRAICNTTGDEQIVPRAGNGTFSQSFEAFGHDVSIQVRGNSLVGYTAVAPEPEPEPELTPFQYAFYRFVRFGEQVASLFNGAEEVEGSRELTDVLVDIEAERVNFSQDDNSPATGMGVEISVVTVTGTLNYEYVRRYTEQFERIYEWVDVTGYKNADGVEVVRNENVRYDSEFVCDYAYEDGDEYYTEHSGYEAIEVEIEKYVRLCRGNGQHPDEEYGRTAILSDADGLFTVEVYLANTASTPRIDVRNVSYDTDDFDVNLPTE